MPSYGPAVPTAAPLARARPPGPPERPLGLCETGVEAGCPPGAPHSHCYSESAELQHHSTPVLLSDFFQRCFVKQWKIIQFLKFH